MGYRLPLENLRQYLAAKPDREVTYELHGEVVVAESSRDGDRSPLVQHKLVLIRAVDERDPMRCQMFSLPAG
jgi:hypothetical protein